MSSKPLRFSDVLIFCCALGWMTVMLGKTDRAYVDGWGISLKRYDFFRMNDDVERGGNTLHLAGRVVSLHMSRREVSFWDVFKSCSF